jgi:hypothetical protein
MLAATFYTLESTQTRTMDKLKSTERGGVYHLVYVDEKDEKEDENLRSLQKKLKELKDVGIEEGFSSINKDYKETIDDFEQVMFPWRTPTEVLTF